MSRALPYLLIFGVLVVAGFIYAMNQGGSGSKPSHPAIGEKWPRADTLLGWDDPGGFPVRLKALRYPPYGWRIIGFYPNMRLCKAAKYRYEQRTGRLAMCEQR